MSDFYCAGTAIFSYRNGIIVILFSTFKSTSFIGLTALKVIIKALIIAKYSTDAIVRSSVPESHVIMNDT